MDDSVPTTSKAGAGITSPLPPRKRKQLSLGHLSLAEKQAILNLYKKSLDDDPTLKTVQLVSKIAMRLGAAKSTVYRAIKQYKSTGRVSTSKHCGGRPGIVTCLDEVMKNFIRRVVHSLFLKNEIPTLDKILTAIKSRQDLPQMSRSSLYKVMKQINFKYLKRSRKSVLIERDDIVRWRLDYSISIKKFRSEGRPIYYLDETYHCELNPIEFIWAQVKNEVASKNKTYKLKDVRELLIEALNNVTNMNWKKCEEHVIKEEEKMGTLDGIMDDLIEPLIISINNSESDMDTDSSNNSESC